MQCYKMTLEFSIVYGELSHIMVVIACNFPLTADTFARCRFLSLWGVVPRYASI
jgi:hypothetical protein